MANICLSDYTFMSDGSPEGDTQLEMLRTAMLYKDNLHSEYGFTSWGTSWFLDCVGEIANWGGYKYFEVTNAEDRWASDIGAWDNYLTSYFPNVDWSLREEECGCDVYYIREGCARIIYDEKYLLEVYDQNSEGIAEDRYHFEDKQELEQWLSHYAKTLRTIEDIKAYAEDADDFYFHEFEIERVKYIC